MDKKEIWLPVKGYEGLYEVSSFGRVRSLGKGGSGNSKMRIMNNSYDIYGYLVVGLYKNGKQKQFKVHRLVAEAFIPNWFNDTQINHIDEDKTNNHIDNLEWCSPKENSNHGTRIRRITDKNINGKCSIPVLQYTKEGMLVGEWPSMAEIERRLGFFHSGVIQCCTGKINHYKGYIWRYKEVS